MPRSHAYKRILLKLSGESLVGSQRFGIDSEATKSIATMIQDIRNSGIEVAVVIGGGNIFRGVNLSDLGMPRTPADQMGMLATLINGIALQQALLSLNCDVRLMSALECPDVAESFNWNRAQEALTANQILIFVGGTGHPYFTTDTAAALRASEMNVDLLVKATKVNGVFDKDPNKHPDAKQYFDMTYTQFLTEKLEVMDSTSVALCMNNRVPIFVCNMQQLLHKSLKKLFAEGAGTFIKK